MVLDLFRKQRQALRSLLLGSATMIALLGCCSRPKPIEDDRVIVVEKSKIVENPDGSYTVNKAWMLERMQTERDLADALELCVEGNL